MSTLTIVLLVIALVLTAAFVALYFFTKRMEKKQDAQREQMDAMAQSMSMLIIDKKRMRLKDSGLPQTVIDQSPKILRRSKVPIVKAKIGPRVMTLMCDEAIFDQVPVKKEVKAVDQRYLYHRRKGTARYSRYHRAEKERASGHARRRKHWQHAAARTNNVFSENTGCPRCSGGVSCIGYHFSKREKKEDI